MDAPIPYMGGKSHFAPFIVSLFPEHSCYCEVFGGAASVLFYKNSSKFEVYNDINKDLVNVFLQIKDNYEKLVDKAYWLPYSRQLYNEFMESLQDPHLDSIEKAVRFLYLNKVAFSGQYQAGMSLGPTHKPNWNQDFFNHLKKIRKRLDSVIIECLDFQECIKKYDRPTTLFYLDPPYWAADATQYYRFIFTRGSHDRLLSCCSSIEGKFIISYEDIPIVQEMYKDFYIHKTPEVKLVSSTKEKKDIVHELCITNFIGEEKQRRLF